MTTKAIDYLCNLFTPKHIAEVYLKGEEEETYRRVGRHSTLRGYEPREFREKLSSIGLQRVLITAFKAWDHRENVPLTWTPFDEVLDVLQAEPDFFYGLFGINVRARMPEVREVERSVKEYGFKGIHIHPHGFGLPTNHAYYFPFYAKCEELGVPVVISTGHTLAYLPMEPGRPSYLDDIALYFPDLKIVCGHTGWPWVEEAIALASKHPNVYLGTSAYAPKYWKPEMVQFLNSSRGRHKTMWGTDYPLVKHEEGIEQIGGLGLREESKHALLYENAARVFGFA